jgi:hypothetical protein
LLFINICIGFSPYLGHPPELPRVFSLLTCGNSSQYTYQQSPKNRTAISAKLNFLQNLPI